MAKDLFPEMNRYKIQSSKHISCSCHRTTKFLNSKSPIFTTKFCLSYFLLDQKQDQQSAAPSITLSKRASKKNVFHKKINKKVNKQNIRNSKNQLFDDVSEIYLQNLNSDYLKIFKTYELDSRLVQIFLSRPEKNRFAYFLLFSRTEYTKT